MEKSVFEKFKFPDENNPWEIEELVIILNHFKTHKLENINILMKELLKLEKNRTEIEILTLFYSVTKINKRIIIY